MTESKKPTVAALRRRAREHVELRRRYALAIAAGIAAALVPLGQGGESSLIATVDLRLGADEQGTREYAMRVQSLAVALANADLALSDAQGVSS